MIRHVTESDLPWLEALALEFNELYWDQPINVDKYRALIDTLLDSDTGVMIRNDTGAIVGIVYEDPIRDHTVLVEIGWYSNGFEGMHLLDALIAEGIRLGVDEVRMSTLECNKRATVLLRRRGFKQLETSHSLRLGD